MNAFPNIWPIKPLSELVYPERGISYGVVQPGANDPNGTPIIRVNNLRDGRIITEDVRKVSPSIADKYHRTKLRGREVLLSVVGTVGETLVVPPELAGWNVARAIAVIPVQESIGPEWINLCLRSAQLQGLIRDWCNTTVQATLNLSDVARLPIPLPKPEIRQRIAEILGRLDDKIEANRRINRTLEQMAQALYKHWFVDFGPFQEGEFVESELGLIPAGWGVDKLENQIEAIRGLSYKGKFLAEEGAVPMHNLNSVFEGGGYKYEGIKYYAGDFQERHIVESGDLIVANTEQGFDYLLIGCPAIIPRYFGEKGIFSHHLYRVRPVAESPLTRRYLYLWLRHPQFRASVTGFANGTTVNMLPIDGLQWPTLVIPPSETIEMFEKVVKPYFERSEMVYAENAKLAAIRDYLLPRLLSGGLAV